MFVSVFLFYFAGFYKYNERWKFSEKGGNHSAIANIDYKTKLLKI